MTDVVFYFQVHQPFRLHRYTFFDIGHHDRYFDDDENARIFRRVAEKCYLPVNALLLRAIERSDKRFRCSFSISGTALDQMETWYPEVLESFQKLAATGAVEFLAETSHHSLAFLADEDEFREQVRAHTARIERLFGQRPTVFRNTELVVSNAIARTAEKLGFQTILGEGADHLLGWRTTHQLYRPEGCDRIKIMLRSYRLADDIAFRFSNRGWGEYPLTAEKFSAWVHGLPEEDEVVGLFMDYETFGEHQWADTGVLHFLEALPEHLLRNPRFRCTTASEAAAAHDPVARLDIPHPVSWADAERDLTAWTGNRMQQAAHDALYAMAGDARAAGRNGHPFLLQNWRKLTTSDHLYYMCTKWFSDGDVHKYFSPFPTPHDAFITFMNVLDDLGRRLRTAAAAPALESSPQHA